MRFIGYIFRIALWLIMVVMLLGVSVVIVAYTPWAQDKLRVAVVEYLNRDSDTRISVDEVRLRFPLDIELKGFSMVNVASGDTMIAAGTFNGSLDVRPLLHGEVSLNGASATAAKYQIGTPDSTMYLVARMPSLTIAPSRVNLGDTIDINLSNIRAHGGRLDMVISPDTVPKPDTIPTPGPAMRLNVKELELYDFTYNMRLLPTIDSLGTSMEYAVISDARIDLLEQTVNIGSFKGNRLNAAYIVPDEATIAATPVPPPDTVPSPPWTVDVGSIAFDESEVLYTTRGYKPQPGMDFGYLKFSGLDLEISNFHNRATEVLIPIDKLSGTERSGLKPTVAGTLAIDSAAMNINGLDLTTANGTRLRGNAMMSLLTPIVDDPSTPFSVDIDGRVAFADVMLMFPDAKPLLSGFGASEKANLDVNIGGNLKKLNVRAFKIDISPALKLALKGKVVNPLDMDRIEGDLDISGSINPTHSLMDLITRFTGPMTDYAIPALTIDGNVSMHSGIIAGKVAATTGEGKLALDAKWNQSIEGYDVDLHTINFPVHAFMPALGVGNVTADITASGQGFDLFSPNTRTKANINIKQATYQGYTYRNISVKANIAQGIADLVADSDNADARGHITARGNLSGGTYSWAVGANISHVDLLALRLTDSPMTISADLDLDGSFTPASNAIKGDFDLRALTINTGDMTRVLNVADIRGNIDANNRSTALNVANGDLTASVWAGASIERLSTTATVAMDTLMRQMKANRIDITSLHPILPPFDIDVSAGMDNMVAQLLEDSDMSFDHLHFAASNDSIIAMQAQITDFRTGETTLNSIDFKGWQMGRRFVFRGLVDNEPGNLDEFAHVRLRGAISAESIAFLVTQHNAQGEMGYNVGAVVRALPGGKVVASLRPDTLTVAYTDWVINHDNYVMYDFKHRHLDADLHMQGGKSSIMLYTEHGGDGHHDGDDDDDDDMHLDGHHHVHYEDLAQEPDSMGVYHDHHLLSEIEDEEQEDIILKITDVHLEDWLAISPMAPPIKGDISADLRLNWNADAVNGNGSVSIDNLVYGREKVGDFRADLGVTTDMAGKIRATADLMVNGQKTVTIAGNLNENDTESPFNLDFSMIRFPLSVANAFLPADMARLAGTLNGTMEISGDANKPRVNGFITFDRASVNIPLMGSSYAFGTDSIPVRNNVVRFSNFGIKGVNGVPIDINGIVDVNNPTNASVDLSFVGKNVQLVNSKKAARGASVYGKAFINLDADVYGNMRLLNIDATLDLLNNTNVSYVLTDAETMIADQGDDDMVKFVNFNDSTDYAAVDSIADPEMSISLNALLRINSGAVVNVDLNSNGSNRVQIQPSGNLNYTLEPMATDGRLTGRLNINKGFVRYSNVVISEKYFTFNEGSYVNFTGEMLNPQLNIHATDQMKANVTQEGQNSRLINFDVGIGVTGTLENMNIAFDLSTDDDITIANELQGMTAEQRASQAMNLLLYGMYTGPGAKANANLQGNLYSFLASQLNSLVASKIHGVDLSFGIDQYNRTQDGTTSQTMSYSYKLSKSLFDDRFKIVVGGNYSTDANADENFSQNLISDISFEYLLNKQGSMVVRLFRHTGFESILEGEITQTGVGFVYKRKIRKLSDMFRPFRRRQPMPMPLPTPTPPAVNVPPAETEKKVEPDSVPATTTTVDSTTGRRRKQ